MLIFAHIIYAKVIKDFYVYRMEKLKMEFEISGISYRLHGVGCAAFNKDFFLKKTISLYPKSNK